MVEWNRLCMYKSSAGWDGWRAAATDAVDSDFLCMCAIECAFRMALVILRIYRAAEKRKKNVARLIFSRAEGIGLYVSIGACKYSIPVSS